MVRETFPEVPAATTAVTVVAFTKMKEVAGVPPKLTADTPVKLVPVMLTVAPVAALVGEKEEMTGAGMKVNPAVAPVFPFVAASAAAPAATLTLTSPATEGVMLAV